MSERTVSWIALAVLAALLLTGAASLPLLDPDEARFARTSLEMSRRGDAVVPYFEGEPRLVKPPMLHWMQGLLFRTFGAGEAAARLPAQLATLLAAWLTAACAARRFGAAAAPWTIVVLGTMPLVVALGRIGTLDALLALHVSAVVLADWSDETIFDSRLAAFVGGAMAGLAFLVKGPVGPLLIGTALFAGRWAAGRGLPRLSRAAIAVAGCIVVAAPWSLALLGSIGVEPIAEMLRVEVLDRSTTGTVHVEPFWYYLPAVLAACLPWSGLVLFGIFRALLPLGGSSATRYLAAGSFASLVVLSLSSGKRVTYIASLLPLFAAIVVGEIGRSLGEPARHRQAPMTVVATLSVCAAAFAYTATRLGDPGASTTAWIGAVAYGLAGIVGWIAWIRRAHRTLYIAAAGASATLLAAAVLVLLPELHVRRSTAALIEATPALHDDRPVVLVDVRAPSLTWYLDRLPELVDTDGLPARLSAGDDALYVVADPDWSRVAPLLGGEVVGRSGKYRVVDPR